MQRCAHCGHFGRRSTHCSPRKKKSRPKAPRPRQRADKNNRKRGILPTECFIPVGTPRYSHTPFDDTRCIRLLVLLPGDKWEPVRCELVVRPLDNAHYEAISYAWGPKEEKGDILCHDQRLKVPWNLEHGLRKFRRLRKKRVLWADSVCINQDDKAERGHQVQNMSRIYENTKRVLVWLGFHEYSNPSALFEFIRALGPLPPPDYQSVGYIKHQIKVYGWKHWQTFNSLDHTGWFRRLWVIQEICLAPSAIVHCGPASLDWNLFASFCDYMFYYLDEINIAYKLSIVSMVLRIHGLKFQDSGRDIPSILNVGRVKQCADPRDHIYAFLGHKACLETISNPDSELFLPVDYSISHKDLYTSVAIRILQAENLSSLHIINFVSHNPSSIQDRTISSWVPRWDIYGSLPFVYYPTEDEYKTHGQTAVEASLNGSCLNVAGFTFDSVVWASDTIEYGNDPFNGLDASNQHPFVQVWNHARNIEGRSSNDIFEILCTMISNKNKGSKDEERFVSGAVAYAYSMGLDVSGMEHLVAFEAIPYFFSEMSRGHRYFFTSRGWVGLGPRTTLLGDDVCIFFGAPTPFVVRQLPSAGETLYRLCGPCDIPGIMQGEAIKMFERGAFDRTTFNLI